jgi:hypothetical protein
MYNSILGRSVVVFTIVLFAKYNIMLGLGLVLVAIYMYPDSNYMRYMEGMENVTTTATPATATANANASPSNATPTPTPNATATAAKKDAVKASVVPSKVEGLTSKSEPGSGTKNLQAALAEQIKTIAEQMPKLTEPKKEGFTENKKHSGTTDRIATEERLRPKTSVTSQLYQGRGHGVSTNNFQEPSPNSSNGLGFAFLS